MNKICTSIEQSEKLMELGLDVDTSDMFYADLLVDGVHKYNLHPLESYCFKTFGETKLQTTDHLGFIPAWSLSALLELIPSVISLSNHEDKYNIRYANEFIIDQKLHDSYIDACYEVVVWLKENGKI